MRTTLVGWGGVAATLVLVLAPAAALSQQPPRPPPRPGGAPPPRPAPAAGASEPAAPSPGPTAPAAGAADKQTPPRPGGGPPRPGGGPPRPGTPDTTPAPTGDKGAATTPDFVGKKEEAAPKKDIPPIKVEEGEAPGFEGPSGIRSVPPQSAQDFVPIEDRWRIGMPSWDRYPGASFEQDHPFEQGAWWNPYSQNVLKGDYPILGQEIFMILQLTSDTLIEGRSFPIPAGISTSDRREEEFFDTFDQFLFNQNFIFSLEIFKGDAAFRPKDLVLKAIPVVNINYVDFQAFNAVNIDVRREDERLDGHVGVQELIFEYHVLDLSPYYDFLTVIGGIQPFTSDFRGFLYSDNNLGVRVQANYESNRYQFNFAWFHQLEKDTNSGLNEFSSRDQNVFIANFFWQDFLSELTPYLFGYTALVSWHYNRDDADTHFDDNGFIVRPSKIGAVASERGEARAKEVNVHYLGWGGDGHIGVVNVSHQYYWAIGKDEFNEIAGKRQTVNAHFFAIEASIEGPEALDLDWLRFKTSFMYQSGDKNPRNNTAAGFDAIFDNPFFAGSGFSYFHRQNIPFVQTGTQLTQRLSLLANIRSSKIEGQANHVNPGLFLYNVGVSAKVTPKVFVDINVNYLRFAETEVLELTQVQGDIDRSLGLDYSIGVQYRPLLTENVIITLSGAALTPFAGFEDIYTSQTLYSAFAAITLTY